MFPKNPPRDQRASLPRGRDLWVHPSRKRRNCHKTWRGFGTECVCCARTSTKHNPKGRTCVSFGKQQKSCASRKGPENHRGCQIQVSLSWLGFNLARWQYDCRLPEPDPVQGPNKKLILQTTHDFCLDQRKNQHKTTNMAQSMKKNNTKGLPSLTVHKSQKGTETRRPVEFGESRMAAPAR